MLATNVNGNCVIGFSGLNSFQFDGDVGSALPLINFEDRFELCCADPSGTGGGSGAGAPPSRRQRHSRIFSPLAADPSGIQSPFVPQDRSLPTAVQNLQRAAAEPSQATVVTHTQTVPTATPEQLSKAEFFARFHALLSPLSDLRTQITAERINQLNAGIKELGIDALYALLAETKSGSFRVQAKRAIANIKFETLLDILSQRVDPYDPKSEKKYADEAIALVYFFMENGDKQEKNKLKDYYNDLRKARCNSFDAVDRMHYSVQGWAKTIQSGDFHERSILIELMKTKPDVFGFLILMAIMYGQTSAYEELNRIAQYQGLKAMIEEIKVFNIPGARLADVQKDKIKNYNELRAYMVRFHVRSRRILALFGQV